MSFSDTEDSKDDDVCHHRHGHEEEGNFENEFLRTLSKLNDELCNSVTKHRKCKEKKIKCEDNHHHSESKKGIISKIIHKVEDKLDLGSVDDSSSSSSYDGCGSSPVVVTESNSTCEEKENIDCFIKSTLSKEDCITPHHKKNKKPFQKVLRNIHLNNNIITRCIQSTDALNKNYINLLILLNDYIYDRLETNNTQLLIIFTHLNTYLVTTLHELSGNNVQSLVSVNNAFIDFFKKVNRILSDLWSGGKCMDDLDDI